MKDTFRHNLQHAGTFHAVMTANIGEIEEFCKPSPYGETYLIIEKTGFNNPTDCKFNLVREPAGAMRYE